MLIPPLMQLRQQNILPQKILETWVILPAILYVGLLLPELLMRINVLPDATRHLIYFLRGFGEFAVFCPLRL